MHLQFISGLPRSGSTLLAALLRQNPALHASIISPLGPTLTRIRESMSPNNEVHLMWSYEQQTDVCRGLFHNFYVRHADKHTVFDTNRRWCLDAVLLAALFPDCRIICCVRNVRDILLSFEKLFRKSPITMGAICNSQQTTTLAWRVNHLLHPDNVVGFAYNALKDAWQGPERKRLLIVEYDDLVADPYAVLERLHDELKLPDWVYNRDRIDQIPDVIEFDHSLGVPGLHSLRKKVALEKAGAPLPVEIAMQVPPIFWR